jgi:hypothetical protein
MDTVSLSRILHRTTYAIDVYQREEKYSSGSGCCIHPQGFLVTAAHVVTGRLPIREEDWQDPDVTILARTSDGDFLRYEPAICGLTVEFPGPLKEAIQVDLAILRPAEPRSHVEHLGVSGEKWPVGTPVLMAGYPDELEPPLLWTKAINYDYEPIKESIEESRKIAERMEQLIVVKSGMIAHSNYVSLDPDGTGAKVLDIYVYYVDNVMHSGSSGGPVVNAQGEVIGIITTRAVTKVSWPDLQNPNKEVPSGSALAVSPHTIVEYVNEWV